jgi:hypothetical protein
MRRSLIALLALTATAHANGRPPLTNSVHFRPGYPHSLYVGTTFGLLVSQDDGCTFDWLCEDDLGYGGTYDPIYAIDVEGTIFATTFTGLHVSRDGGCSFTVATDQFPVGDPRRIDGWIGALALDGAGAVWIGTADTGKPNDLYLSTDHGVTFTSLGQSAAVEWNSLQVAPSDTQRVYATAYAFGPPGTAELVVSKNGGAAWTPSALAGVTLSTNPLLRVAAVDPSNPDVVYVVSGQNANPPAGDLLYRSSDGGATLTQVLATTDPIRDVVIADADHVIAATQLGGTFQSSDAGHTFTAITGAPQLSCLGRRSDGALIGCGANWDPDFMAVASSTDVGASWQKVWRFVNIYGPLACPAGTPEHDKCVDQWQVLQMQFGASGPICGDNEWPKEAPQPSKTGGCCEAGTHAPSALALLTVLGCGLVLRRRR